MTINPQQEKKFILDAKLAGDTFFIKDLKLSSLLLMNDSRYPWLILVPRKSKDPSPEMTDRETFTPLTELFELNEQDLSELMSEISFYSQLLKEKFTAKKINVANLGNIVSQLHIHIIARNENDEAWPGPVWGRGKAVPYTTEELSSIKATLGFPITGV